MPFGARIRSRVEHRSVRPQHRWPDFKSGLMNSAASVRRIPQLHDRAAGARPCSQGRIVDLRIRAAGVVLKDVGIHGQDFAIGQQIPAFFIVDVELTCTRGSPGQSRRIEQRSLFRAAVRQHEGPIRQDDGLRIADCSPAARRRDGSPPVCQRIVNRSFVGPDCAEVVVLPPFDDNAAIGQHGRGEIERRVAGRHGSDLRPHAVDVAAVCVRRQLVPLR